jgi:hypothetical protein
MQPNSLDHRSGYRLGAPDELIEAESQDDVPEGRQGGVAPSVSPPRGSIRVKRVPVGLEDDCVFDHEIDSADACEGDL